MSRTIRSAPVPGTSASPAATLAILAIAQFLIALDYSIVYIALPGSGPSSASPRAPSSGW
jgi:hypothetical protein